MKIVFFLSFFLFVAGLTQGSTETLYAKKSRVKVKAEQSPMSSVLLMLGKGDMVTVVEKKGRHLKIRLKDGREGWVFKFKLSSKKPQSAGSSGGFLSTLTGESSVSTKESRSGGSIRGLKKVSKEYAQNSKISPQHIASVERMEKFSITENELQAFKSEGALGEFAK